MAILNYFFHKKEIDMFYKVLEEANGRVCTMAGYCVGLDGITEEEAEQVMSKFATVCQSQANKIEEGQYLTKKMLHEAMERFIAYTEKTLCELAQRTDAEEV